MPGDQERSRPAGNGAAISNTHTDGSIVLQPGADGRADVDLAIEARLLGELGGNVLDAADIGSYAVEYAVRNWRVFPLRGKLPAIANPHPQGSRERQECKGDCGRPGHGVLDATTEVGVVSSWWGGRYAGANIGGRVPESMFVLDVDPRHGGDLTLAAIQRAYGTLPTTLTTVSGRGDGGMHLFFRRPVGVLSPRRIAADFGPGIDIKTSTGYVVLPPSIHPDSGKPYRRLEHPVAAPPHWLVALLRPEPQTQQRVASLPRPVVLGAGPSIAERYNAATGWAGVLQPHGWRCLDGDADADGARWRHPNATAPHSATIRGGRLYVYSPNTPFDVTESSDPHGYSRFHAYAVLNHGGDMSAAARVLKGAMAA
ncbi:bifunctional DNA primase/polymerase famiily protein [Mycobacteroides abscessus subsp. massiliense]|uniref:bifunctional DNA primase/polymerase n=1 Tax=Mycobacteroides abscessus TaxID=36809 RepID=UPI0009A8C20D|nr:bifunctional DNA primase/polymerase [Mycobacteroides abscessus]SLH95784.1 bifunctional DNA primase/polymerase famiily protein [Mycobacteroides abscessus subsp. massiliense]SLI84027.1 bifunctional DNA primase/polymerase famiily protein [Mycobacteroides abscessus subsp. massiliense]